MKARLFLWACRGCAATCMFRDLATDHPGPGARERADIGRPTGNPPHGEPCPDRARDAIGPAMPAGAVGVTLYLARLAGASWPRSEGRGGGVSWEGRRWRRWEGVGCGQARGGERARGEGAVRVRALEPLNARSRFLTASGHSSGGLRRQVRPSRRPRWHRTERPFVVKTFRFQRQADAWSSFPSGRFSATL